MYDQIPDRATIQQLAALFRIGMTSMYGMKHDPGFPPPDEGKLYSVAQVLAFLELRRIERLDPDSWQAECAADAAALEKSIGMFTAKQQKHLKSLAESWRTDPEKRRDENIADLKGRLSGKVPGNNTTAYYCGHIEEMRKWQT